MNKWNKKCVQNEAKIFKSFADLIRCDVANFICFVL